MKGQSDHLAPTLMHECGGDFSYLSFFDIITGMRDIWEVILATASSVAGLAVIIYKIDPANASFGIFLLFYLVLFLSIWGLAVMAGYGLRRLVLSNFMHEQIFLSAFWQGAVVSVLIVGFLIFNKFF